MSRKITNDELLEKFNKLYEELGRIPNRDEMGHREPIKRLYGNYNNFVRGLGHLPNLFRTREDYIEYIQKTGKELNKVPSIKDLRDKGVHHLSIYRMFGSYNKLLELAGFESREMVYTDKSDEDLLLDYIKLCNKLERWATTRDLDSVDIYENRFGNIIEVRKSVVDSDKLNIKDKSIEKVYYRKYTDDDIKQYVIKSIKIYGKDIKKVEFMKYLKDVKGPSINTITKRHKCTSFRNMIDMYKD